MSRLLKHVDDIRVTAAMEIRFLFSFMVPQTSDLSMTRFSSIIGASDFFRQVLFGTLCCYVDPIIDQ